MKKFYILLLTLCLALTFTSCTPPSSDDGNDSECKHTQLETLPAHDATCTATGLTEGKKCLSCGEIIQAQTVIEIKAHSFDNSDDKVCNSCGFLDSKLPTFLVSETKTVAGNDDVAVKISLMNNPGISSIILSLTYDNTDLALTGIKYNTDMGGQTVHPEELESPVTLYWINGLADTTGDLIFATLYFDVAEAAAGEYDIQISYNPDNVYNIAEENLAFEIIHGKIVIE